MGKLTVSYSHAAPYIREQILNAVRQRLNAKTLREQRYHVGVVYGLTSALEIMYRSDDLKDNIPDGWAPYRAGQDHAVLEWLANYMSGEDRLKELGFTGEAE